MKPGDLVVSSGCWVVDGARWVVEGAWCVVRGAWCTTASFGDSGSGRVGGSTQRIDRTCKFSQMICDGSGGSLTCSTVPLPLLSWSHRDMVLVRKAEGHSSSTTPVAYLVVVIGYWLAVIGWRLVVGGWWLVVGG